MNPLKNLLLWMGWIIWKNLYIYPILCLVGPIFVIIFVPSFSAYFDIRPFGIDVGQITVLKERTTAAIGIIGGGIGCLMYVFGIWATTGFFSRDENYRIAIGQAQKIRQQKPELVPSVDLLIGQTRIQKNGKRLVEWMEKEKKLEASGESLERLKKELPKAIARPAQLEVEIKEITEKIKTLRSELLTP